MPRRALPPIAMAMALASSTPARAGETATPATQWGELGARVQPMLGVDVGFAHYGRTDGDGDVGFGPSWQVRAGLQVLPWLSLEGHYLGTRHDAAGALMAHAGSIDARFSLPLRRVRPFASVGAGLYTVIAYDANGNAIVVPDPALQLPAALGLEVVIHQRFGVQVEGSYRFLLDKVVPEAFARAQMWTGSLGARVYL